MLVVYIKHVKMNDKNHNKNYSGKENFKAYSYPLRISGNLDRTKMSDRSQDLLTLILPGGFWVNISR